MSLIPKETLLTHLQRAEMADSVTLPIEFFRDLIYQAMPRERVVFPTMLRRMWSGGDVQEWLDNNVNGEQE